MNSNLIQTQTLKLKIRNPTANTKSFLSKADLTPNLTAVTE